MNKKKLEKIGEKVLLILGLAHKNIPLSYCRVTVKNNFLIADLSDSWCDLEDQFWYINLRLTSKFNRADSTSDLQTTYILGQKMVAFGSNLNLEIKFLTGRKSCKAGINFFIISFLMFGFSSEITEMNWKGTVKVKLETSKENSNWETLSNSTHFTFGKTKTLTT